MTDRVLVAGATGGVGAHIVRKLLRQGASVRILVRDAEKRAGSSPGQTDRARLRSSSATCGSRRP